MGVRDGLGRHQRNLWRGKGCGLLSSCRTLPNSLILQIRKGGLGEAAGQGSPSERSEASLHRGGAAWGSLGVAKAGHWWARLARRQREEAPCLLASSEQCLCSLSLFSICLAPAAFQASPDCVQGDKRADEQEISGGSGVTQHRHDGGGWMAEGGPGRVIGLPTSCTERFSEGHFAHGSQARSSNPGSKAQRPPTYRGGD